MCHISRVPHDVYCSFSENDLDGNIWIKVAVYDSQRKHHKVFISSAIFNGFREFLHSSEILEVKSDLVGMFCSSIQGFFYFSLFYHTPSCMQHKTCLYGNKKVKQG